MPRRGQRQPESARGPNGTIARGTRYGLRKRAELEAERDRLLRALYTPAPAELVALREAGVLSESTELAIDCAAAEVARLRLAVEGEPAGADNRPPRPLSPQREAQLGRAQRLLGLGLALQFRALTADDREAASSAGTLISKADALINSAVGLDTEAEVPSLSAYIEQRRLEAEEAPQAASHTNGCSPAPEAEAAEIVAQNRAGDVNDGEDGSEVGQEGDDA